MHSIELNQLKSEYQPKQAIIIYHNQQNDNYYLEGHAIENGEMKEAKPLSQKLMKDIALSYSNQAASIMTHKGLLSEEVLHVNQRIDQQIYIWYRKAAKVKLNFSKKLHIPSGEVWVPPLLFAVTEDDFYVFALKDEQRPTMTTELFMAPFHNVYNDGEVCMGSVKTETEQKLFPDFMKHWENLFYNSDFTHLNDTSNPTKSNLNTLWKSLVKKNKKFPMGELKVSEVKTVKNLFKKLDCL